MTATALKDAQLTGSITYYGFEFGGAASTPPAYKLVGVPVYDEPGRTVTHIRYELEVATIIYAESEDDTSSEMQDLRRRLTRPGRRLELLDIGLGDTVVAAGGSHPDLVWGARPQVLELSPVGGSLAWQLVWRCQFNVGEYAGTTNAAWLAFNFAARYTVDHRGLTTRVIAGHVIVPQARAGAGRQKRVRVADRQRDRIHIAVPHGFRRKSAEWEEALDRARLEFNVVDEELGGDALPPGMVDGDLEFRLENPSTNSTALSATLAGWLEAAPGTSRLLALRRLLTIAQAKLTRLRRGGKVVLPGKVSVSQKLFTRRTQVHFEFVSIGSIFDLLRSSGIWEPVEGYDYRRWRASMESLWENRGHAGLAANDAEAAIIDLADNPTSQITIGRDGGASLARPADAELPLLKFQVAPPHSWLHYEISLRVERRENVSLHSLSEGVSYGAASSSAGVGVPFAAQYGNAGRIREVHGQPHQQVVLEGKAVRLFYAPAVPVLVSAGGRGLVERERMEQRKHVGTYAGMSAVELRWSVTYDVSGYLSVPRLPSNPLAK